MFSDRAVCTGVGGHEGEEGGEEEDLHGHCWVLQCSFGLDSCLYSKALSPQVTAEISSRQYRNRQQISEHV